MLVIYNIETYSFDIMVTRVFLCECFMQKKANSAMRISAITTPTETPTAIVTVEEEPPPTGSASYKSIIHKHNTKIYVIGDKISR